jgi:carbon monoxide dehydrogenase subunit G
MKLENEFTVPAGIDEAWAVLLDVERVAPCLPGAAVEPGTDEEGSYNGTMTVKIGPITARYKGTVRILESDEANRRAVMRAQAKDARGQGTAAATITSTMEEASDGTRVKVVTDMRITGPAAQFGRGVMQDVSAKMMRQFADCLAREMSGPAPAAEDTWSAAADGEPAPAASGNGDVAPAQTAPSAGGEVLTGGGGPEEPTAPTAGGEVLAGGGAESIAAEPAAPPRPRPTPEVLDLADASREAVLKRAAPVVGAALLLLILLRIVRR